MLLLADFFAIQKWKVSLAGYWSDRVLFWVWICSTLGFLIFFWKSLITKIYFFVLLLGLLLSIIAMMIPFYAILFSSTGIERVSSYTPDDGKYRLQLIGSVMARPRLQIIENQWILEKVVVDTDTEFLKNDLSIANERSFRIDILKDTLILKVQSHSEIIVKRFILK
ncbi:hypothetical protein [Sphingobacterium sp. ML3W]|uniref:hypothetical protein n=1 Tax=Sphingobacterium sp. ML3W TaxID=1538644 RepID=UPI00118484E3|nr:hypothetical protein [Sphingobacterium sp. ML3W]